MSIDYTPLTDFSAKDDMSSSNPDKVISGVPFDAEFTLISQKFALAAPALNAAFTGTTTLNTVVLNGETLTNTDVGLFKATTITVAAKEATWDATAVTVAGKEAGWDATKAEVEAYDDAGWDATKATVDAGNANWDTAYGWGDHGAEGYITSFTNTTYTSGSGLALAGTVFSHADTSDVSDVAASGSQVLTGATFDPFGHVLTASTGTLTGGTNISVSGHTITGSSNPVVTTVVLSNGFIIDQTSSTIIIRDGVTKLFELDESGNLEVAGNITAYATL